MQQKLSALFTQLRELIKIVFFPTEIVENENKTYKISRFNKQKDSQTSLDTLNGSVKTKFAKAYQQIR